MTPETILYIHQAATALPAACGLVWRCGSAFAGKSEGKLMENTTGTWYTLHTPSHFSFGFSCCHSQPASHKRVVVVYKCIDHVRSPALLPSFFLFRSFSLSHLETIDRHETLRAYLVAMYNQEKQQQVIMKATRAHVIPPTVGYIKQRHAIGRNVNFLPPSSQIWGIAPSVPYCTFASSATEGLVQLSSVPDMLK